MPTLFWLVIKLLLTCTRASNTLLTTTSVPTIALPPNLPTPPAALIPLTRALSPASALSPAFDPPPTDEDVSSSSPPYKAPFASASASKKFGRGISRKKRMGKRG